MTSLGEAEIYVNSLRIGRVRVRQIQHLSAVYPRLGMYVEITLQDTPANVPAPITNFQMHDLSGELRVTEHGDALGQVAWVEQRHYMRSSVQGTNHTLQLACDLDPWRLELGERRRNGQAPTFWLQLWPSLLTVGEWLEAQVPAFQVKVPREMWLDFLGRVRQEWTEILEITYRDADAARFAGAVKHMKDAQARIDEGDYNGAVALCRKVVEVLEREVEQVSRAAAAETEGEPQSAQERRESKLKRPFVMLTDEKRGPLYAAFAARLKDLANLEHHDQRQPVQFSRVEAMFILRTTASTVALLGGLATKKPGEVVR